MAKFMAQTAVAKVSHTAPPIPAATPRWCRFPSLVLAGAPPWGTAAVMLGLRVPKSRAWD